MQEKNPIIVQDDPPKRHLGFTLTLFSLPFRRKTKASPQEETVESGNRFDGEIEIYRKSAW